MIKLVFGGSFDPIHNGHLHHALSVRKFLEYVYHEECEIVFVLGMHKHFSDMPHSVPYINRLNMLYASIAGIERTSVYEEIEEDFGYMRNTVFRMKRESPDDSLILLIGSDQHREFSKWYEAKKLLDDLDGVVRFSKDDGFIMLWDFQDDLKFESRTGAYIYVDPVPVSSTQIRNKEVDYMLYTPVIIWDDIKRNYYERSNNQNSVQE